MSNGKGGSVDQQKFWLIILLIVIVIVFSKSSSQEERMVEAQSGMDWIIYEGEYKKQLERAARNLTPKEAKALEESIKELSDGMFGYVEKDRIRELLEAYDRIPRQVPVRDEPYIKTREQAREGGYAQSIIELYPPEALVAKEDAQKLKEALYDPWFNIDEDTVFNILENTTSKDHRKDMIAEYKRLTGSDLYNDLNRLGLNDGLDVRRARILYKDGKIQKLDGKELLYTEDDF